MDETLYKALMARKMKKDTQSDLDNQEDPGMLQNLSNKLKNDYSRWEQKPVPEWKGAANIPQEDIDMMPTATGSITKVGSDSIGKFLKMRQALQRPGGYGQRLADDAGGLVNKIEQATTGGSGNIQDLAIRQQMLNKLRGLK